MQPSRYQGAIRAIKKGYGFIAADDGHDYFFHWTSLSHLHMNDLRMKQRVEFSLINVDKGLRAIDVIVIQHSDLEIQDEEEKGKSVRDEETARS